ncbi:MAG: Uma2 family endonuclease [Planctomycetes bacterium]|nr:Uma2 family endonuclease [Planctomycetota bacterium]
MGDVTDDEVRLLDPPLLDEDGLPLEEPLTEPQGEVLVPLLHALLRHAQRERLPWFVRVNAPVDVRDDRGQRERVIPDLYVLVGEPLPSASARGPLRTWVLGRGPTVVVEVSSAGSLAQDRGAKREQYEAMGVLEYFVLDLDQREVPRMLEGHRRDEPTGRLVPIASASPRAGGLARLPSTALGLDLEVVADPATRVGYALRVYPPGEDAPLPTPVEAERDQAVRERDEALARLAALEAELRRRGQG